MTLDEFIKRNNVTSTSRLVNETVLDEIEKNNGLSFGKQLKKYVLEYGYLSYKHVELYGINSNEIEDSDMIKQTLYIHKYYPITRGFIALENQGEGDYYIVDENDNVYEYDSELAELSNKNIKVFDYILNRFVQVN